MAKAFGQEPVQVPHWMQALTMFRIVANESVTGSRMVAATFSISIFSVMFMTLPF